MNMTEFEKRCITEMKRSNDLTKISMSSMLQLMDSMMSFMKTFIELQINCDDDEEGMKVINEFYTEFSKMTKDQIRRIEKQ